MTKFQLAIDPEDNPEVQSLVDEYNRLNERFADLNCRILRIQVPFVRPWHARRPLNSLGVEVIEFENKWNAWNQKARAFLLNPHLIIPGGSDTDLTFLHFTADFRMRITDVESEVRLLRENVNNLANEYWGQRNLLIALTGIVFSLIGLALALAK